MNNIFLLVGGSLCILLAAQVYAGPRNVVVEYSSDGDSDDDSDYDSDDDSDYDSDDDDDEEEEPEVDLNCILFGNAGCNAFCSSLSLLYGRVATGHCLEDQNCECQLQMKNPPTIRSLWREVFRNDTTSEKVLKLTIKFFPIHNQLLDILKSFPRTPKEIYKELKVGPLQIIDGFRLLKLKNEDIMVQKYIDANDNVNYKQLRQDLSQILKRALAAGTFPVKNIDYAINLKNFLQNVNVDERTKQYIEDSVAKTDNITLKKLVDPQSDNKAYDFGDVSDVYSYDIIPEYVAAVVSDELTKYSTTKTSTQLLSTLPTPSKKRTKALVPARSTGSMIYINRN